AAAPGGGRRADGFNLELGIAWEGRRISLLPALLELLDRLPDAGQLGGLLRLASRCIALPVGDGVYLPLPADRLKRVLGVVRDLYEGRRIAWRDGEPTLPVDPIRAAALVDLEAALAGD